MQAQARENDALTEVTLQPGGIIAESSPAMRAVDAVIPALAQSRVPVLLLGEAGTGKRTIAQRIHAASGHPANEFSLVACSKLTPADLEGKPGNVLFGSGTVYLDEVASLQPACQTRLFEILTAAKQDSTQTPLVHLIYGSTCDLDAEVRSEQFGEDLCCSISGVCLRLPPLRQRKQDILPLMTCFLAKYAADLDCPTPMLSQQMRQLLHSYAWPGNIQELKKTARAIVVLGDDSVGMDALRGMLLRSELRERQASLKESARMASREAEKALILGALTRTRWNRRRAAQELKISYKSLLYRLRRLDGNEFGASGRGERE